MVNMNHKKQSNAKVILMHKSYLSVEKNGTGLIEVKIST